MGCRDGVSPPRAARGCGAGAGTWMRLLPQSATMMLPLASTATPVGALNCPFPSPCDPNLKRNSPSALYTWGEGVTAGCPGTRHRHQRGRPGDTGSHPPRATAALTFTEWLWKSVTTISFLLLTATKWGPGEGRVLSPGWGRGRAWHGTAPAPRGQRDAPRSCTREGAARPRCPVSAVSAARAAGEASARGLAQAVPGPPRLEGAPGPTAGPALRRDRDPRAPAHGDRAHCQNQNPSPEPRTQSQN